MLWKVSRDCVLLMPKPALSFSEAQKTPYREGSIQDGSAPCLGLCLADGYMPQDMSMGADGRPVLPGGGRMSLVSVGELMRSLDGEWVWNVARKESLSDSRTRSFCAWDSSE